VTGEPADVEVSAFHVAEQEVAHADPSAHGGLHSLHHDETEARIRNVGERAAQVQAEVVAWVKTLVSAGVYAILIVTFGFQVARVEGMSMAPTLEDQDRLIVNKLIYRIADPRRGDIVMLYYPVDPQKSFVKRVIAEEGDKVRIVDGRVYVNGVPVPDNYVLPEFRSRDDYAEQAVDQLLLRHGRSRSNSSTAVTGAWCRIVTSSTRCSSGGGRADGANVLGPDGPSRAARRRLACPVARAVPEPGRGGCENRVRVRQRGDQHSERRLPLAHRRVFEPRRPRGCPCCRPAAGRRSSLRSPQVRNRRRRRCGGVPGLVVHEVLRNAFNHLSGRLRLRSARADSRS
jgi:signal peptidase I